MEKNFTLMPILPYSDSNTDLNDRLSSFIGQVDTSQTRAAIDSTINQSLAK